MDSEGEWRLWFADVTTYGFVEKWLFWKDDKSDELMVQRREVEFRWEVVDGEFRVWGREVCLQWHRHIIGQIARHWSDWSFHMVRPVRSWHRLR